MKKMWKKAIAMLLVVIMIGGAAPLGTLADMEWPSLPNSVFSQLTNHCNDTFKSAVAWLRGAFSGLSLHASASTVAGLCGDDVHFWLDTETKVLTIRGSGLMNDYSLYSFDKYPDTPWYPYRSDIKTVIINDGVKSIGDYAFFNCTSLTSITIASSVTRIGQSVFSNCSSLINAYYNGSVSEWCDITFDAPSANPLCNTNLLYISGIFATEITIPDSVTHIGDYAFYNYKELTNITIPSSVTSIGRYAFSGCTGLTNVVIPDSITAISDGVFYNCKSITDLTISNNTKSIGNSSFNGCQSLSSVRLPSGIISIGENAFYGCSNLTSVYYGGTVTDWCGIAFNDSVFSNPLYYAHKLYISNTLVTDLIIPNSVRSVGQFAFSGCTSLSSVSVSSSVTSIGAYSFSGCSGLKSVSIANGVITIEKNAFSNCSRITSLIIPDSVMQIGSSAFRGCTKLTEITLPFVGLTESASGIDSVFGAIFGSTSTYTSAEIRQYYNDESSSYYYIPSSLREVTLTNCRTIPYGAFYNCYFLTKVTIPDGVARIGDSSFKGCRGLTNASLPNSVESIGANCFYGCSNLQSIEISSALKDIGDSAFYNCSKLANINIPDKVKTIGSSTFFGCSNLVDVELSDGITSIGGSAFKNCSKLALKTIPDGVVDIGNEAFSGCTGITELTIPKSVTRIGTFAFKECSSLTSITLPFIGLSENSSGIDAGLGAIFYYDNYKRNDGILYYEGGYYYHIPQSLHSVTVTGGRIPAYAFYNCSMLTHFTFSDDVNGIGVSALEGTAYYEDRENWKSNNVLYCGSHLIKADSSLMKYIILEGTKTIADEAFCNCLLSEITIPDGMLRIGNGAFKNCQSLLCCILPDSVIEIGENAFMNCRRLAFAHISSSATSIGKSALLGTPAYICSNHDSCYAATYAQESGLQFRTCAHQTIHNYSLCVITPPTCTEQGYTTLTCSGCGNSYKTDYTSALGHDYSTQSTPATCTQSGIAFYTCLRCGDSYSEALPATGHVYSSQTIPATCTKPGIITYFCTQCDERYTETIPSVGHSFGAWIQSKAPTEYEYGEKQRECSVCHLIEKQTVDKLPYTTLTLNKTSITLNYKDSETLTASEVVTWSSSNEKVVKVDPATGKLTTIGKGTATITAHSVQGDKTATCEVTVKYTFIQMLIRIFLLGFIWY